MRSFDDILPPFKSLRPVTSRHFESPSDPKFEKSHGRSYNELQLCRLFLALIVAIPSARFSTKKSGLFLRIGRNQAFSALSYPGATRPSHPPSRRATRTRVPASSRHTRGSARHLSAPLLACARPPPKFSPQRSTFPETKLLNDVLQ